MQESGAQVFVVGAGYVGLTTAVGLAALGHRVVAHDIDDAVVGLLSAGRPQILEAGMEQALGRQLGSGRLSFTTDPRPPAETLYALVCVPTPKAPDGRLGLDIVESVVSGLVATLPDGAMLVVRSTLPLHGPDRLEALVAARPGLAVVVNPEFMREGRALEDFAAPSRISVGWLRPEDEPAARRVADLYASTGAPTLVADARSTVLLKLASNAFLGMKIAFADELARLADAMGASVEVVADGIGADPRIGRAFLDAGPGFGGSCLPEQAEAIAVETAVRDLETPLLQAIGPSNHRHQAAIVARLASLLATPLEASRVAILGLAFKAGTSDVRRSPGLALAAELRAAGASVVGFDPAAMDAARSADPGLETAVDPATAAAGADAIVIATEWSQFRDLDWTDLAGRMRGRLVYDTRRTLRPDVIADAGLRLVGLGVPETSTTSVTARTR